MSTALDREIQRKELEKLNIEISELKRPLWSRTGFIAAMSPLALALIAFLSAWLNGYFDRTRVELAADIEQLIDQRGTLTAEYNGLIRQRILADLVGRSKYFSVGAEHERGRHPCTREVSFWVGPNNRLFKQLRSEKGYVSRLDATQMLLSRIMQINRSIEVRTDRIDAFFSTVAGLVEVLEGRDFSDPENLLKLQRFGLTAETFAAMEQPLTLSQTQFDAACSENAPDQNAAKLFEEIDGNRIGNVLYLITAFSTAWDEN